MPLRLLAVVVLLALAWLGFRRAGGFVGSTEVVAATPEVHAANAAVPSRVPEDGLPELVIEARDRRGRHVPRLTVVLEHADQRNPAERRVELSLASENGRFELDGLAPGRWKIDVKASPWRVAYPAPGTWLVLPRAPALDVLADAPAVVEALVEDALGRPTPNVTVEFRGSDGNTVRTATDNEGRARSGPLEAGLVVVDALRGRATARARCVVAVDAREEVRLRLPGGSLSGVLVDGDGRPIPDTWVEALAPERPDGRLAEVLTDVEGHFRFPLLEPGEVRVGPSPPANRRANGAPPPHAAFAVVRDGEEAEVRVVLGDERGAAVVQGTVLLGELPVPDAALTFLVERRAGVTDELAPGPGEARTVRTDRGGAYRVGLARSGRWVVLVELPGRTAVSLGTFELPDGPSQLALRLPLGELEGRLVDPEGRGIAGALVVLAPTSPWAHGPLHAPPAGHTRERRTAADGTFVVGGLAPGAWQVFATPEGGQYARVASRPLELRVGVRPAPVELVTAPAGTLRVRFEGLAVDTGDDVRIDVRDTSGRAPCAAPVALRGPLGEGLTVTGLAPGTYRCAVRTAARVAAWSEPFVVRAGETVERWTQLRPGGDLTVEVRDGEGRPIPAALTLVDPEGLDVTGLALPRSDRVGLYSLGPLPPGEYTVAVAALDGSDARGTALVLAGETVAVRLDTRD